MVSAILVKIIFGLMKEISLMIIILICTLFDTTRKKINLAIFSENLVVKIQLVVIRAMLIYLLLTSFK